MDSSTLEFDEIKGLNTQFQSMKIIFWLIINKTQSADTQLLANLHFL